MPLASGSSQTAISHNIAEMREAGYPENVAVAAAEREAHDALDCDRLDAILAVCDRMHRRLDALGK